MYGFHRKNAGVSLARLYPERRNRFVSLELFPRISQLSISLKFMSRLQRSPALSLAVADEVWLVGDYEQLIVRPSISLSVCPSTVTSLPTCAMCGHEGA